MIKYSKQGVTGLNTVNSKYIRQRVTGKTFSLGVKRMK